MIGLRTGNEPSRPAEARPFSAGHRLPGFTCYANSKRTRRAFSLVELLVVLSVGTAMLMIATSVLYLLKETQIQAGRRLDDGRRISRLADQFRDDVHAANRLERQDVSPDTTAWKLSLDPETAVVYELRQDRVRRQQTAAGRTIHDDFPLPAGLAATIASPAEGSTLATLRLEATAASPPAPHASPRPVRVEAVLGLNTRYALPKERNGQ